MSTTNEFCDRLPRKLDGLRDGSRTLAAWLFQVIILSAVLLGETDLQADDQRSSTVGMPARIDQIVLPGPELEATPLEDERSPIVLRITGSFPHGTAFRYDIQYYGLEPGEFDLKDYLRRKDRSPMDDLAPLTVNIESVLPPGQVKPNVLATKSSPYLGGYWTTMTIAGMAWLLGFVAIIWWICAERANQHGATGALKRPATLAERLRPIVQDAIVGKITETQLAALERMLIAFWRKQLKLDDVNAVDAIAALRRHPEAGALLEQLELWLHRPGDVGEVDVAELLKPYQDLPADALKI